MTKHQHPPSSLKQNSISPTEPMFALQLNSNTKYLLLLSCCGRSEHRRGLGGFILGSLVSEITTALHESPGYPNCNITWTSFTKISRILRWDVTPWHTPFYPYYPEHQKDFRAIKKHLSLGTFFFPNLHLFSIYFWAEHHLYPPRKPSSQDKSKLTQILIMFQIIREQSWHPNTQTSLEQVWFVLKVREKGEIWKENFQECEHLGEKQ